MQKCPGVCFRHGHHTSQQDAPHLFCILQRMPGGGRVPNSPTSDRRLMSWVTKQRQSPSVPWAWKITQVRRELRSLWTAFIAHSGVPNRLQKHAPLFTTIKQQRALRKSAFRQTPVFPELLLVVILQVLSGSLDPVVNRAPLVDPRLLEFPVLLDHCV